VVLNSGRANACTGPEGFAVTHHTAERAAAVLGCGAAEIAVCSTGRIGERLPLTALLSGVDAAAAALDTSREGGLAAARAVMTTDTVPKQAAHAGAGWTVGGLAKGAGMVAPSLATVLAVLTTDAAVDAPAADAALRAATRRTFDRLDIDGQPWLLRLANLQHLATSVTGRLADLRPAARDGGALGEQASALALAAALHPTAAVGGTPTGAAMELIRELEGMDRGRYAGPVGWIDAHGNSEFGIALRCAELDGLRARLFAGCGIVADSDPVAELAETQVKFRPMQDALEG